MKTGRTLQDIAAELERQTATRKDYLAPQEAITAIVDGEIKLAGLNGDPYALTPHAHRQLATHLEIPQKYYDRMATTQPDLLAANVNTWLHANGAERRMLRTLDGRIRGILSPKFRPLDNFDLAQAVLPTLLEKGAQIMSAELTETRLYIKAILPSLSDELPEGMIWGSGHNAVAEYRGNQPGRLVAAIVISNSDVGAGSLRIEPSTFTTWCTNLAIMAEAAMRKYHVGKGFNADDNLEVFRDETRQADDRALWMKVQDITRAAFAEEAFRAAIDQIRNAGQVPIVSSDLPKVVELAVRRLSLPEASTSGILTHLARGGDLTQWGLSSAITALANDATEYEAATELERAGGKVLSLSRSEWSTIAA